MAAPNGYHEIERDLEEVVRDDGETSCMWLEWAEVELDIEVEKFIERQREFSNFLLERGDEYPI